MDGTKIANAIKENCENITYCTDCIFYADRRNLSGYPCMIDISPFEWVEDDENHGEIVN